MKRLAFALLLSLLTLASPSVALAQGGSSDPSALKPGRDPNQPIDE
jgi:hypothetical protein